MAEQKPFKTRVKEVICKTVKKYRDTYIQYDYLILSKAFSKQLYYIIKSEEDNFLHLTGVNSSLGAKSFFDKCIRGELSEDDFDFNKKGQSEKSVKGTVRKKISVLGEMSNLLEDGVLVREDFSKNLVQCSFATADGSCTLGYVGIDAARPKTLMKGNQLKDAKPVEVILRRKRNTAVFDTIIIGDSQKIETYKEYLLNIVSEDILGKN